MATLGRQSYIQQDAAAAPTAQGNTASGINTSVSALSTPVAIQGPVGGEYAQQAKYNQEVMDSAFKVVAKALEPKIKEQQAKQAVFGIQQAAKGKAITEIRKEQPFLSKWYGDTTVTESARKYTANANAMELANGVQRDMEELQKLSPEKFEEELQRRKSELMTGDAQTDIDIDASFMQQLPVLTRTQIAANNKYEQNNLAKSAVQNSLKAIDQIKQIRKQVSEKNLSEEEGSELIKNLTMDIMSKPETLEEGYYQSQVIPNVMQYAVQEGAVDFFKRGEEVQARVGSLNPASQVAFLAAQNQASDTASHLFLKDVKNQEALSNALLQSYYGNHQPMIDLNGSFQQQTGSPFNLLNVQDKVNDQTRRSIEARNQQIQKLNENTADYQYKLSEAILESEIEANPYMSDQEIIQKYTQLQENNPTQKVDPGKGLDVKRRTLNRMEEKAKSGANKANAKIEDFNQSVDAATGFADDLGIDIKDRVPDKIDPVGFDISVGSAVAQRTADANKNIESGADPDKEIKSVRQMASQPGYSRFAGMTNDQKVAAGAAFFNGIKGQPDEAKIVSDALIKLSSDSNSNNSSGAGKAFKDQVNLDLGSSTFDLGRIQMHKQNIDKLRASGLRGNQFALEEYYSKDQIEMIDSLSTYIANGDIVGAKKHYADSKLSAPQRKNVNVFSSVEPLPIKKGRGGVDSTESWYSDQRGYNDWFAKKPAGTAYAAEAIKRYRGYARQELGKVDETDVNVYALSKADVLIDDRLGVITVNEPDVNLNSSVDKPSDYINSNSQYGYNYNISNQTMYEVVKKVAGIDISEDQYRDSNFTLNVYRSDAGTPVITGTISGISNGKPYSKNVLIDVKNDFMPVYNRNFEKLNANRRRR